MDNTDFIVLLTRSGTYVLALAVFILTWLIQRIAENAFPSLQKQNDVNAKAAPYLTRMSRWWNEVILYIIPVLIGGAFGLFMQSSFLFGEVTEVRARITLGGVVGWLASFLYKVLRKVVKQRLGVDLLPEPDEPMPVDAPPGPTS